MMMMMILIARRASSSSKGLEMKNIFILFFPQKIRKNCHEKERACPRKYVSEREREREKVSQTLKPLTHAPFVLVDAVILLLLLLLLSRDRTLLNYETRVDFNHSTTLFKLAELLSDMASSVS